MTGSRWPIARTAGFAVLYVAAALAGRLTALDGSNLSLVWPAAGVAVVWFCASVGTRWHWLDAAALAVVTIGVNASTGAPVPLAAAFAVANLVQIYAFLALFRWMCPHLWGGGGRGQLARITDLWRLVAAAGISTAAGAAIGPTAVWIATGQYSWLTTTVWLTRNTVSIVLIGTLGLRVAFALQNRRHWNLSGQLRNRVRRWDVAEYVAVVVASAGAYYVAFGINHGLPLAFPLLIMTVWAGLRLNTTFVVLHDLSVGTTAVLFTLHGDGPFADIGSYTARALIAQAFVGMVSIVGLALALSRDERQALLRRLSEARREATGQARLMTAIVRSTHDALDVVAEDGRVLLRNPAALDLFGETGYPRLTRTDGSHLDHRELLHAHGTDVRVGDTRIVEVSATELPAGAGVAGSSVVMFHDVTAERRHRDELAAFAGVVAHDLLNPLTTIDGWASDLADQLAEVDHPELPDADRSVDRIRRGAARMQRLISDLLEYTTARDGVLAPTTVALAPLVEEIVMERAEHALASGKPVPEIRVGTLPAVHADPTLVRHVFDNVIGNAVKYTAPRTVPRIVVDADESAPGWVTVSVADRGIGIPPGQHDSVFDNFHRAHRAEGYTGTGLGLAICKRVVERHGGTIVARDNPDGGTVVSFTLPAAAVAVAGPVPQTVG